MKASANTLKAGETMKPYANILKAMETTKPYANTLKWLLNINVFKYIQGVQCGFSSLDDTLIQILFTMRSKLRFRVNLIETSVSLQYTIPSWYQVV